MVDAEVARRLLEQDAADAGRREDRVGVRHHDERAEAAVLDEIDPPGEAVDPRVIPRDREHDRRVEQDAEVVAVVRVLVEVADVGDDPPAERLLDAELALIALAGRQRLRRRRTRPSSPTPLDSSRFSLYGVSSVRPYEARSTVPLPGTAYDTPRRGCTSVAVVRPS